MIKLHLEIRLQDGTESDRVRVDFNQPLAGRSLLIRVKIIKTVAS